MEPSPEESHLGCCRKHSRPAICQYAQARRLDKYAIHGLNRSSSKLAFKAMSQSAILFENSALSYLEPLSFGCQSKKSFRQRVIRGAALFETTNGVGRFFR